MTFFAHSAVSSPSSPRLWHRIARSFLCSGSALAMLGTTPCFAFSVSYDFEGVVVASASDSIDVCQPTCPGTVVSGLPNGANGVRASSGSSAARVNIRNEANAINAVDPSQSDQVFEGFFSSSGGNNRFLVLGDNDGLIHAGGSVSPGTGQSYIRLPFFLPAGTSSVGFSFDFAFKGIDSSSSDDDVFTVKVTSATGTDSPIGLYAGSSGAGFNSLRMTSADRPVWSPAAIDADKFWWLEFELLEGGDGTHSAVGIDNIAVSSVPLPASAVLFASALLGLGTTRPRRPVAREATHVNVMPSHQL